MNKNNYIANLDEIIFINEIVENNAIKYSNNIALSYKNESLSYFELNKKADLLAKEFLSLGLEKNDFIGIIFNHSIDLIISLLAILKIGGCYIPIDSFSPKDRIEFIIEDSSPKAIIIQNKLTNFSFLENNNTVHNIFNDNKLVFIEKSPSVLNKGALVPCLNTIAYIIYTSGSTGKPKGTKISHKNVLSLFESCKKVFSNLNEKDKWVLFHSFAFDYSIWEIWGCFYFGAELLIIDKELTSNFEPFYKEICEKNITVLNQTPSAFNYFSREAVSSNLNHNLKYLVLSGEAMNINLLEKWFEKFGDKNTEIINSYGITETTVFVTFRKIFLDDLEKKSRSSIGIPLPHLTCYVLDKNKNILPNGVSGELFVGGLGVSSGYLNRDELTKERFIDNPFGKGKLYKTGDHVRVINNQELEFLGRLDNQVKIRGFRIELGEIENNLNNIEGISESVVIIKEDKTTGNYLVAYILEEKNNTISKEEIKNLLRLKMPEVMIPNIYIKVESFPLNNNGKIDKKLLPEDKNSIISDKKEYISPKNQIEKQIYQVLAELLKTEKISIHDNFFDMGAHSLLMVEAHKKIQDITKLKFELIEMFNYPTIHSFSNYLKTKNTEVKAKKNVLLKKDLKINKIDDIAIIGISCRFPEADNLSEFFENLKNGVESVKFFSDEELIKNGVNPELIKNPNYVKANAVLDNIEYFDAEFFGYNPREAEILDPQQRIFLECAYNALEDAGYNSYDYDLPIGVFCGSAISRYLFFNLSRNNEIIDSVGQFQLLTSNDKDYLAVRTAYKLNLKGPSITLQTACSTSLVAMHNACQSLILDECEIALAGGVTIDTNKSGYLYQEGSIASKDGHCRAFDEKLSGIVGGSGVGIVVLKKLSKAIEDNDNIYAVIKASSINNDGSNKIGFMAPSIEGQSEVILSAIEKSGIDPEKIEYIEAHGTGTQIGDPIEVMALKNAYSLYTDKKNYCAIGSVKTNIGHLDAASGISGLIKTILSIKNGLIFPTLHFEKPNSNIDFENSPFFVNNKLLEWNNLEKERFAGVSSFGLGGTNVHVILQEYLDKKDNYIQEEKRHLIILSAKTEKSLDDITKNYENISENLNIQDIAYTLQVGRKDWNFRRFFIAKSTQELKTKANNFIDNSFSDYCENKTYTYIFLFSGLGTQKIKAGFELYKNEPIFKEEFQKCRLIFNNYLEKDIKDIIFDDNNSQLLNTPTYMQPAIFIIQYSMAKLWISKGIIPDVLLGHSFGEYVAWAISEAILLEDIIKIVSIRGSLFEKVSGTMIAVSSKSNEIERFLNEKIVIVNYNAEDFITLSGDLDSIIALELKLKEKKIAFTRLSVPHATHCYLLDNIIEEFSFKLKNIVFKNPKIKIISNLTGKYIKENEFNLEYIINHTLKPVLFYQGLSELANEEDISFLELGTSDHLIKIIQRNAKIFNNFILNSSLSSKNTNLSEYDFFLTTLGFLWQKGYKINWDKNINLKRVSLPLYQFDRKKYWVDALEEKRIVQSKKNSIEDMFYIPSWKKTFIKEDIIKEKINNTLVFSGFRLSSNAQGTKAHLFRKIDDYKNSFPFSFDSILTKDFEDLFYNYSNNVIFEEIKYTKEEYNLLFKNLKEKDVLPEKIICFLPQYSENEFIKLYFDNLLFLIQEIGNLNFKTEVIIISKDNYFITGNENILPEQIIFNCFLRTVKQEYTNINVKNIDIDSKIDNNKLIKLIYSNIEHKILAIRNNNFWLEDVQKISLDYNFTSHICSSDIFVITGGLGGIGLSLAEFLAKKYKSKIVLIDRNYGEKNISESSLYQKIKEIRGFSECYILKADINIKNDLESIFTEINNKIGKISYFIHSAGIISSGLISIKKSDDYKEIFSVKIDTTKNIYELCNKYEIKKLILFSSLTTILGGIGETAYISANSFLNSFTDKYSHLDKKVSITTINWCSWKEVGMAKKIHDRNPELKYFFEDNDFSITSEEGNNVFDIVLNNEGITNIFISPLDIKFIQEKYAKVSISNMKNLLKEYLNTKKVNLYERPKLKNTYIEAKTDLEIIIKNIWQENLGIKNIGIEDNFFDLGGHSLLLAKMKIDLEEKLGYELPMSSVFNANTIKELAIHLEEKVNSVVIPLKKQGDKNPIFCVHAVSGTIFPFYPIAKNIDKDTPFYAIQSYGFSENANPFETIKEMASFYISGIKNIQKSGPYIISGWSFGSLVALEIAHQLIKNGDKVEKLIVIDMNAPIGEEFRKSIDEEFLTNRFNIDMKGLFGQKFDSENINVKSLYKVFKGNINASLKYEGKKIDTEIILFRAIENIEEDNLLNWDKISDNVKLFNIKGDHYSIIKSPDFFEKLNNLL